MIKQARIGRLSNGRYRVYSRNGKNLGTYDSYAGAKKRLSDVEMFKHMDKKSSCPSLMYLYKQAKNSPEVTTTYSAMMRELHKNNPELIPGFMRSFKDAFDRAIEDEIEEAENAALLEAIQTTENAPEDENQTAVKYLYEE